MFKINFVPIDPAIPTNSHRPCHELAVGRWVSTNHWIFSSGNLRLYLPVNNQIAMVSTSPAQAHHLWRRPPCRLTRWRWWRRSRAHRKSSRRSRTWIPNPWWRLGIPFWKTSMCIYMYIYIYMLYWITIHIPIYYLIYTMDNLVENIILYNIILDTLPKI